MPDPVLHSARRFFAAHPVPPDALLVAAVSGGADSLALLFALAELAEPLGVRVHAAYLHHGMRAAADADQHMVQRACAGLGVPFHAGREDVPELARNRRVSLEVAGRIARYRYLFQVAAQHGAHALCTGHTKDDQAETVLLRVVMGTGLDGLGGIAPARRAVPPESPRPVWLLRPLLDATRAETAAYCAGRGVSPIQDPANDDPRFPRNRIRQTVLPLLERAFNPAIRDALSRLADIARADGETLDALAEDLAETHRTGDGGVTLHRRPWLDLPLSLQRRLARRLLLEAGASGRALAFANVERLLDAARRAAPQQHLEGGLWLSCDEHHATLAPRPAPAPPPEYDIPLPAPGSAALPHGVLTSEVLDGNAVAAGPFVATLDADALDAPLTVRNRRPGDRMRPLGMSGSRTVGNILTDRKIPPEARRRLPLVMCGGRIAWLAGVAVSEDFRVRPETRRVVRLRFWPPPFGGV